MESDNLASSVHIHSVQKSINNSSEKLLKKVEKLENTLKSYEIVSMLFLLHKDAGETYSDLEAFLSGVKTNLISNWCKGELDKNNVWESKLYESIFSIKNYKLLKEFDIIAVNAVHHFNHKCLIPNIRIELYGICENIIENELDSLLKIMEETDLRHKDYLEMYILKWISEGKMSVDAEVNVGLLMDSLETINRKDLAKKLLRYHQPDVVLKKELQIVNDYDDDYPIIDPNDVGLCVIVNQEKFSRESRPQLPELKERRGTNVDCKALNKLFEDLKFDVQIVSDVVSHKMTKVIRSKIETCFKPNHSIFCLIILSHGNKDEVYGTDSKPVHIVDIDYCLLIPQLEKKPKVVIIQACQGEYFVKASPMRSISDHKIESDAPVTVKQWPVDTIFCMSTIPLFASYRHHERGSWYIQTLCEIFNNNPEKNIQSLLMKVNGELYNKPVFGTEERLRSIPEFRCRLEKNLYLKKK